MTGPKPHVRAIVEEWRALAGAVSLSAFARGHGYTRGGMVHLLKKYGVFEGRMSAAAAQARLANLAKAHAKRRAA